MKKLATNSLFSENGEPLGVRLFFVQNPDQLSLQIHTDKKSFKKKEKVSPILNAKNRAGLSNDGHFAMTIINESKVSPDENNERNILTNLLLTFNLSHRNYH